MNTPIGHGSTHRATARVRALSAATFLITPLGTQPALAADPQVHLTVLDTDTRISRKSSFTITWTSANIPPNTALSLRLYWQMADSGVRIMGKVQPGDTSRLLTSLFDAATMKTFLEKFKSNATFPTIETGSYVWDVGKFCAQNTENGHSVCDSARSYRLQLILRAANDPCADNVRCDKARTLFKTELSRGAISFSN
ncbi:MAG TPA: hypothetical protein VEH00_14050 [Steroidobacteraceae bacterium]|nr:hypothetical protein [Steroidobacteraceae bacterium]